MSVIRILTGIVAALAIGLAFAGPASAKQVYDYKYSGTYLDGAGTEGGPFTGSLGDVTLNTQTGELVIVRAANPGALTKITTAGAPSPFSTLKEGLGSDTLVLEDQTAKPGCNANVNSNSDLAIDNSGGPHQGAIYIFQGASTCIRAYRNDGSFVFTTVTGTPNPTNTGVAVGPDGEVWRTSNPGSNDAGLAEIDPLTGLTLPGREFLKMFAAPDRLHHPVFDSQGNIYAWNGTNVTTAYATKYPPEPTLTGLGPVEREQQYRLNSQVIPGKMAVDPTTDDVFLYRTVPPTIEIFDSKGGKLGNLGEAEGEYPGVQAPGGITVDPVTHDVWVANNRNYAGERRVEKFERVEPPITVPTTDTEGAVSSSTPSEATLHGTLNPDGIDTTSCRFEWGSSQTLGNTAPCVEGDVHSGSGEIEVTAQIDGLSKGVKYWYRLLAENANGRVSDGGPESFIAQSTPQIESVFVDAVNTDGARLNVTVDPNGGRTWVKFEYGETPAYGRTTPRVRMIQTDGQDLEQSSSLIDVGDLSHAIGGLEPGTDYHFRAVAENEQGATVSDDFEFRTYVPDPGKDLCPNTQERLQSGAALLADCRAYELASAAQAGGADVVSSLNPELQPLVTSPRAPERLLYSVDSAVIPGIAGNPTNLGRDPYIATRGPNGWTTEYVGLPAQGISGTNPSGPFGSPLLGFDDAMRTFAFGGSDICDPCFPDGSTNVPLRRADGSLQKGMAGTLNPAADPTATVRRPVSADGSHFVFGASEKFESGGNAGSPTIYARNLNTNVTRVVSTTPAGATMTGDVAQLDISADGSRVLIGRLVDTDAAGNEYYDLYMNTGGANSVKIVEGPSGALFNGMTADGTQVYFSTVDPHDGDADTSRDFFRAVVGPASAAIARISAGSGGTGNTDACDPPGDPDAWNVIAGPGKCDTVAFAGGAGVARGSGTAFFVSPELLDGPGNGIQDEANLYVVEAGGAPQFVGVMDSSLAKGGPPPPDHPLVDSAFVSALAAAEAITVDPANGDIYVVERTGLRIARYDSSGAAKNFEGKAANTIFPLGLGTASRAQVAIDRAATSPLAGSIYAKGAATLVNLYDDTATKIGELTGHNEVCGVAIDQSTGTVYVGDRTYAGIWKYVPNSATQPVTNANYTRTSIKTDGLAPCQVAADSNGYVYAVANPEGAVRKFSSNEFSAAGPTVTGTTVQATGRAVAVDPASDDLYVNDSTAISRYDEDGRLIQRFGSPDELTANSRGIAVDPSTGVAYTTNDAVIRKFGVTPLPYVPIDNPAIARGVKDAANHSYADFQITPDGRYAAFNSAIPLTGYLNRGHMQIFRYDTEEDELACPSCPPTKAAAQHDTSLSPNGLGLTDSGEVFFTTRESFVLRDSNRRDDAYQWKEEGVVQLISRGLGAEDSALLGVSADGVDAFFFTRDRIVPQDGNGNAVKIYDARVGGGFLHQAPPKPCAASDECHGPGSRAPAPPSIATVTGSGRETADVAAPKRCKKGFVKRKGKCVRKKSKAAKRKAAKRRAAKRRAAKRRAAKRKAQRKARAGSRTSGKRG